MPSNDARHDDPHLRALVQRARAGDQAAWELLYRHAYPRLLAYARRRLPGDASPEDAVLETMTRALEKIDRFRWRDGGFDAWLFGILRLVVLEHQRADRRARPVAELPERAAPAGDEPAEQALRAERHGLLRRAFARLSDSDRELLELRVVGELSAEEVATVVGRRAGAVRMAQTRALDRLRAKLRESEHA
ncbi:sigma-70 family RNA polymerase sigma factor [Conexibacter sp. JD483]|uniref:RNA polymerase sigma factor n=1 Tax=unclassified Conexibacter TaxID=2627773 RepID=UPI002716283C|nr:MULTISPECIES: sigma-70 family RNA polymerase sigma factor [unclassified Conexibacter]MDO8188137.1 sigma-70 family RNA polymerase sigma factor [Conexibacter sp. CPCC 205706]MDO8201299.1 sigma-70 family RNA polymerase sigma factor [Conexibacter sp. CPCC 205762]MDR9370430.1 sigma-70 family RNA polymerase sigma factor [Conexibacter sp. JD483]